MYPTGANSGGPTILKYTAYMEPLRTFCSRYCRNLRQVETLNELIAAPPQRVEMRHKREQDRAFYTMLDGFKTVKPSEKDQFKQTAVEKTKAKVEANAIDAAEEKK